MIKYNPSETKEYDQDIGKLEITETRKKCANQQEKFADQLCKKKKKTKACDQYRIQRVRQATEKLRKTARELRDQNKRKLEEHILKEQTESREKERKLKEETISNNKRKQSDNTDSDNTHHRKRSKESAEKHYTQSRKWQYLDNQQRTTETHIRHRFNRNRYSPERHRWNRREYHRDRNYDRRYDVSRDQRRRSEYEDRGSSGRYYERKKGYSNQYYRTEIEEQQRKNEYDRTVEWGKSGWEIVNWARLLISKCATDTIQPYMEHNQCYVCKEVCKFLQTVVCRITEYQQHSRQSLYGSEHSTVHSYYTDLSRNHTD